MFLHFASERPLGNLDSKTSNIKENTQNQKIYLRYKKNAFGYYINFFCSYKSKTYIYTYLCHTLFAFYTLKQRMESKICFKFKYLADKLQCYTYHR
ncbi:hypothetical protein HFN_0325 [Helicobacter fennelliae MRY12-0050]|uniref:Uncharacterized protein n=1 Tax=Helicobacter fennelliae MRY12-0050 TaxID=1325130 RepID=T1CR21_9HELI|nr:hypothetical protein HFN_0325 [Helicobacter fennelliae MRY12-0050]